MPDSPIRVLLVEDNSYDVQLVRMSLMKGEESKFDLVHVEQLRDALEQLKTPRKFDLVLLDLGLPDAHGVEVLRRVHEAAPELAIVVLSGLDRGETLFQAIELGAQDYLVKGEIDRQMLRRAIQYAMERKRAEMALRTSQEQFRFAVEATIDAIVLANHHGHIISWNNGARDMFGFSHEEILGQPFSSLMPERYRLEQEGAFDQCVQAADNCSAGKTLQLVGLKKDCTEFPIEVSLSRSKIGGQLIFCGIMRDVSDRKRVEASLQESELRFRTLTTLSPVGIFHTDAAGTCLFVNPRFCEISGNRTEDVVGARGSKTLHPEDREHVLAAWSAAITSQGAYAAEYRYLTPAGQVVWASAHALPVKSASGVVLGYVGTVSDITERKRTEDEREKLIGELQAALSKVKHLSGMISICAQCKKIRERDDSWVRFEVFFRERSDTSFTHGLCPDCTKDFLAGAKPRGSGMF